MQLKMYHIGEKGNFLWYLNEKKTVENVTDLKQRINKMFDNLAKGNLLKKEFLPISKIKGWMIWTPKKRFFLYNYKTDTIKEITEKEYDNFDTALQK